MVPHSKHSKSPVHQVFARVEQWMENIGYETIETRYVMMVEKEIYIKLELIKNKNKMNSIYSRR